MWFKMTSPNPPMFLCKNGNLVVVDELVSSVSERLVHRCECKQLFCCQYGCDLILARDWQIDDLLIEKEYYDCVYAGCKNNALYSHPEVVDDYCYTHMIDERNGGRNWKQQGWYRHKPKSNWQPRNNAFLKGKVEG
jgi:hypothetical protein